MQRKLTITVDEAVYSGLHEVIGRRKISKFIQEIVRPHVIHRNYDSDYAEMAKDKNREKEALDWAEMSVSAKHGQRASKILKRMADRNALSSISDPVEWQREMRQDNVLDSRE